MKTIQMTIDEPLLEAIDTASRAQHTTRSAFIRQAVATSLQRARIEQKEAQHAAGYARHPVEAGEFDVWTQEQEWPAP
jgi:metal-responsive CopG/Arc/MetJ family transcriptional regulator